MTRIDVELVNRKIFETRSRSQLEIKNGVVFCNGEVVTKPSTNVNSDDRIEIKGKPLKYVSRGGLKLEKALNVFNIDLTNKTMLDIGSSKGGFTDCAIQNNIKKVIDIDVGTNQLSDIIRNNPKVYVFENTDFRTFNSDLLNSVDIITIDVSFISVSKLLDKIDEISNAKEIICLIKPQFECGKEIADKYKGIIKDKKVHLNIITKLIKLFENINFYINGFTYSPIKGGNGNIEYLAYFKKNDKKNIIDYNEIINEAFKTLQ